jgi:hypothetical protein
VTPIFFALGLGLVVLLRWAAGWQPYWKGTVIITVELVMVPLGFLAGLGGFDYWLYYASGRPTRPKTTRATARAAGATTSASTPTTR